VVERVLPLPAATPRRRTAAATRRAILDVAEQLLADGGERGLSIREVCRLAGVTPPTIYHHFHDKRGLVDRVVDDCFAAFDRAFRRADVPDDPVERLRWSFDRYVEYGLRHPTHYRLMFQRTAPRETPAGRASYEGLGRLVAEIELAGRLTAPVEDATSAFWCTVHGVTSLLIAGYLSPSSGAMALVRDAMITKLTRPARRGARKGSRHDAP
jgi:AcrR family transcriptional regulator